MGDNAKQTVQRALALILHDPDMPSPAGSFMPGGWLIRCEYCGFQTKAATLATAGAEFMEHMFFGINTSVEHFRYASGAGRRLKSAATAETYYGL